MSKYEGTKTEQNLMTAFAGESQARNKYTFYASQARKAGYVQIANIFEETANQEKEHAKMWFKEFHGIGDVADNLKALLLERTTSGQTCTRPWLRKQRQRDSMNLPLSSSL